MLDADLDSIQEGRNLLSQAKEAQKTLAAMTQEEIDRIVRSIAEASEREAERLAAMAVEETGFGKKEDKIVKNLFSARDVYQSIKDKKTVGIISRDEENKVWETAEPVGVVAGIVPSTNPTSTAIFKALIAVKARNAIVFSPHPGAATCTNEAVDIMMKAAKQAGAPDGLITSITKPTLESAQELMNHKLTDVILATGGTGMVKAAYSTGKPAFGVGPGNVPVYIHESADASKAVRQIIQSKTFDYGTICASEQAIVADKAIKNKVKKELETQGAYFLDDYEKKRMESLIVVNGRLNPQIVGQSPQALAEMAGIYIEDDVRVLVAEETGVGKKYPFSVEKLSPILAFYTVQDWQEGSSLCNELLEHGGLGHTLGIHADDMEVIEKFGITQKVFRVVVNSGTTFGGIGATTGVKPSMTLGCGAYGNNVSSDNITTDHLMNIKRIAFGIRELDNVNQPTRQHRSSSSSTHTNSSISREEVMDIVKNVLKELNL
nr:acetaldehyde dehydrogenase (acetylating) [Bacillus piscicola]